MKKESQWDTVTVARWHSSPRQGRAADSVSDLWAECEAGVVLGRRGSRPQSLDPNSGSDASCGALGRRRVSTVFLGLSLLNHQTCHLAAFHCSNFKPSPLIQATPPKHCFSIYIYIRLPSLDGAVTGSIRSGLICCFGVESSDFHETKILYSG